VKTSLITDTFNLIGFVPFDRKKSTKQFDKSRIKRLLLGRVPSEKPARRDINSLTRGELSMTLVEADILANVEDEYYRRGHFHRVFPEQDSVQFYS
jgi:hypothetical protein